MCKDIHSTIRQPEFHQNWLSAAECTNEITHTFWFLSVESAWTREGTLFSSHKRMIFSSMIQKFAEQPRENKSVVPNIFTEQSWWPPYPYSLKLAPNSSLKEEPAAQKTVLVDWFSHWKPLLLWPISGLLTFRSLHFIEHRRRHGELCLTRTFFCALVVVPKEDILL